MKIERAILVFRSLGFLEWEQIGWRDGRGVYCNNHGSCKLQISVATTVDIPITAGVLIHCEELDPPYSFCESLATIERWVRNYFDIKEEKL